MNISKTGFTQLSKRDFAALGIGDMAYVRPIVEAGKVMFAIHTADGRLAALAETQALAFATVRQNDLQPVSVH